MTKFKVGDMVVKKSDPETMGNVVSTPEGNGTGNYLVTFSGKNEWLPEDELETHSGGGLSL